MNGGSELAINSTGRSFHQSLRTCFKLTNSKIFFSTERTDPRRIFLSMELEKKSLSERERFSKSFYFEFMLDFLVCHKLLNFEKMVRSGPSSINAAKAYRKLFWCEFHEERNAVECRPDNSWMSSLIETVNLCTRDLNERLTVLRCCTCCF